MNHAEHGAVPVPTAAQIAQETPNRAERRARAIATGVFILAAVYTLHAARGMTGGMRMPGGWTMPMMWMLMPGQTFLRAAADFLVMWQAMMIAMMLPSSWPMLELYTRVARHMGQKRLMLKTIISGAGYFTVWGLFGLLAFVAGFEISRGVMSSVQWSRWIPKAAGVSLVLAGVWQLTPLKQACLSHCRDPLLLLSHAYKPGEWGAFRVGAQHGAYCAVCCWALMLMQMILGVMNLAVMTAVAAIIALEKMWKRGPLLARLVGVTSVAGGLLLCWYA